MRGLELNAKFGVFDGGSWDEVKFSSEECDDNYVRSVVISRRCQVYTWVGEIGSPSEDFVEDVRALNIELQSPVTPARAEELWLKHRGKLKVGIGAATKGFRSTEVETIIANSTCSLRNLDICVADRNKISALLRAPVKEPLASDLSSPEAWQKAGFGFLPISAPTPTFLFSDN